MDADARDVRLSGSADARPRPNPIDVLDRITEWRDERYSCTPDSLHDEFVA